MSNTKFWFKINNGKTKTIIAKTGIYRNVVAAIPAMFGIDLPIDVEIWIKYVGGHRFRIEENEYGQFIVKTLVLKIRM